MHCQSASTLENNEHLLIDNAKLFNSGFNVLEIIITLALLFLNDDINALDEVYVSI